jgi:hypothetical protein
MTWFRPTPELDPIDELIPPAPSRSRRLMIGVTTVVLAGFASWLWSSGMVYPQPDCCGGGSSGSLMWINPDRTSVSITTLFVNSSDHDIVVRKGDGQLPGASFGGITFAAAGTFPLPFDDSVRSPVVVAEQSSITVIIRFSPTSCSDGANPDAPERSFKADKDTTGEPWGTVDLDLAVADGWLPSVGRRFRLPKPVFAGSGRGQLEIVNRDDTSRTAGTTPIETACLLLGRVQ